MLFKGILRGKLTKAAIFPGQGSQYVGMGKYLYANFKIAKAIFHEVDETLNLKLSDIIFSDQIKLNLTENTQPAIMTVSFATLKVLEIEKGFKIKDFNYCAGHSLGEYSALVASQSLKLSEAALILKKRGQAMQDAVKIGDGAMAAFLNVEVDEIQSFLKYSNCKSVEISNDNCPGQVVISGKKKEVEQICSKIKEKLKKKSLLLPVSAPFHCQLMTPASIELSDYIEKFFFNKPVIPFISNVSVCETQDTVEIKKLLIDCVYKRVRWREIILYMINKKIENIIEIGPGKSLSNMIKRFNANINCKFVDSLEDLKNV